MEEEEEIILILEKRGNPAYCHQSFGIADVAS